MSRGASLFWKPLAKTASSEPPLRKKCNLSFLIEDYRSSTRAPNEDRSKLPEGTPNWATEPPGRIVEGNTDKASPVPTIGGAEAKTRSSPSHGLALASFDKTTTILLLVGSRHDAYKKPWKLTAHDLISDHDAALDWCRHVFPPTATEALSQLAYLAGKFRPPVSKD